MFSLFEVRENETMRILFYGAGVIGSLYAALLSEAGLDITVYARGSRLKTLEKHGLQYKKNNKVRKASVKVLSVLERNDYYDFIILAVRGHQLLQALEELKSNCSPTIVTMVNSLDPYDKWEDICGKGRILPAFPGAGGGFDGEVLDAALTPRLIQSTTIGRADGREKKLAEIMRKAGIPLKHRMKCGSFTMRFTGILRAYKSCSAVGESVLCAQAEKMGCITG